MTEERVEVGVFTRVILAAKRGKLRVLTVAVEGEDVLVEGEDVLVEDEDMLVEDVKDGIGLVLIKTPRRVLLVNAIIKNI